MAANIFPVLKLAILQTLKVANPNAVPAPSHLDTSHWARPVDRSFKRSSVNRNMALPAALLRMQEAGFLQTEFSNDSAACSLPAALDAAKTH